jgi:hypothetical protein
VTVTTIFTRAAFPVTAPLGRPRACFLPGTMIATPHGYRAIELLRAGDDVLSRTGPRRILEIDVTHERKADIVRRRNGWPVRVPVGSLGNPRPVRLDPRQIVVLEGELVMARCDEPRIGVPLEHLVGLRGLMFERPIADHRWRGLRLADPALLRIEGAVCALGAVEHVAMVPRERARAAFTALDSVGEPKLVRI